MGSRSRRGLGAFEVTAGDLKPSLRDGEDFARRVQALAPKRGRRDWPSLAGVRVLTGPTRGQPLAAWRAAVEAMRGVRSPDRRAGKERPCPELRGDWQALVRGERLRSANAALGLPLHYQSAPGSRERARFALEPKVEGRRNANRFPSPVHLTVVPTARGYLPAMVALTPPDAPHQIEVKGRRAHPGGTIDHGGLAIFCDAIGRRDGWTLHTPEGT